MKITNGLTFNLIFWLLYFLYQWLGLASLYGHYDKYFINACMALPVSLLFSLFAIHVFLGDDFSRATKARAWIGIILFSVALLLVRRYLNHEFIYPRYFPQALSVPFFSFGKLLIELVNLYVITALYALYYFIRSLYHQRNRTLELLQHKTRAELDSLTAQVQPHFVFNTLNNIYASALKDSPETAKLIAHLSGLLDYNLYHSSQQHISLATEITYLQHYLELQKNRYGDKLQVSLNSKGQIDEFQIGPLLFLPLVENCFTHGVAPSLESSWVRIDFLAELDSLSVEIANSRPRNADVRTGPGGIGLANVRKRLELLYPKAHEITLAENEHSYMVTIKLKNLYHG